MKFQLLIQLVLNPNQSNVGVRLEILNLAPRRHIVLQGLLQHCNPLLMLRLNVRVMRSGRTEIHQHRARKKQPRKHRADNAATLRFK